jgi:Abortive infection C-terminus
MNELLEQAETLQILLVSRATGGVESDAEYRQLRQVFLSDRGLEVLLPAFVRTCRSLDQFWQFIKFKFSTYAERRDYLWDAFRPLLEHLERGGIHPSDEAVSAVLEEFDAAHVNAVWSKAMDRRQTDPEGAITAARTLLESVCKHVLDDLSITYNDGADLPKLYKTTAEALTLAPSQHTEQVFRQILGGCTSVVSGLGSLRNKLSDAHGKGRVPVKPGARHAELAVNLAGAMASFLVATWEARREVEA